jgi:hypothetical protein
MPLEMLMYDPEYQRCLDAELTYHVSGNNVHCFGLELVEDYSLGRVGGVVLPSGYAVAPLPYGLTWSDDFTGVQRKLGVPTNLFDGYGFSEVWAHYPALQPYTLDVYFETTRIADPSLRVSPMTHIDVRLAK